MDMVVQSLDAILQMLSVPHPDPLDLLRGHLQVVPLFEWPGISVCPGLGVSQDAGLLTLKPGTSGAQWNGLFTLLIYMGVCLFMMRTFSGHRPLLILLICWGFTLQKHLPTSEGWGLVGTCPYPPLHGRVLRRVVQSPRGCPPGWSPNWPQHLLISDPVLGLPCYPVFTPHWVSWIPSQISFVGLALAPEWLLDGPGLGNTQDSSLMW